MRCQIFFCLFAIFQNIAKEGTFELAVFRFSRIFFQISSVNKVFKSVDTSDTL